MVNCLLIPFCSLLSRTSVEFGGKVLIISLSPEKVQELITLSLVILALGAVFWLIHRVESKL